jgi:hypothetical protein
MRSLLLATSGTTGVNAIVTISGGYSLLTVLCRDRMLRTSQKMPCAAEYKGNAMRLTIVLAGLIAAAGAVLPGSVAAAAVKPATGTATCTSSTFDVYTYTSGEHCYSGAGSIAVDIPEVEKITTGSNTGEFCGTFHSTLYACITYTSDETFSYEEGSLGLTLTLIEIS